MTMTYEQAQALCRENGQEHILNFWDSLDASQRALLLAQVEGLDFQSLGRMRQMLESRSDEDAVQGFEPADVMSFADDERRRFAEIGERALAAGEVGVILVAGGQGSRLGFEGPKGAFPVGPLSHATLFEIHTRKILALESRYGAPVPFYIMTSEANNAETVRFFEEHDCFGLPRDHIAFFVQGMWPALSPDGRAILDAPGHIFMSPDGHGGTLSALRDRGMLDDMQRRGVKTLFYFQVDNPLVEIADPAFIGAHIEQGSEFSVKVCAKRDPGEGLGVVVTRGGRSAVVEYTELTEEQKNARLPGGRLRFCFGSVAIHAFSLAFLKREAEAALPLHIAHKKIPYVTDDGATITPESPNGFKFEKFIFDALPDAARAINVEFAREEEFSPVKNASGADSPATAMHDMMAKFARWLEACGVAVPRDGDGEPTVRIEIDPCYALDAAELAGKLPAGFVIDADVLLR